jgi:hypothetical protein
MFSSRIVPVATRPSTAARYASGEPNARVGPARPDLRPEARVPAVLALPEGRVRAQREERREPRPDPVEHRDALGVVRDGDVHVAAARELLARGEAERGARLEVAQARHGRALERQGRRRERGDPGPDAVRGLLGATPALADLGRELVDLAARVRRGLELLLHELRLQRAGASALVVGAGGLEGLGRAGDGLPVVADEQELFLDPYGAFHPGSLTRMRAARPASV